MNSTAPPISISEIRSFYESSPLDLATLTSVNFRHFRFRLPDGSFYKVKRKIRTVNALKKYLIKKTPLDVYYSTACWLNPHLLGSRVDKNVLKNIMLSCDLAFDIDAGKKLETLEDARKQAVALSDFLTAKGIRIRYHAFSGSKGFHIVCDDPWKKDISQEDPAKREAEAISRRKGLISEAKANGLVFDEKITIDPRRIIRLPGTVNSTTGFLCTVLSQEQVRSSMREILNYLNKPNPFAPWIRYGDDINFVSKIPGRMGRLGVRPKPQPETYYSTFITNNVTKTRLKIPILEFSCQRQIQGSLAIAKKVQDKYGLGDLYILSDGDKLIALSLKAVCRRRVEKILFAARSLNLNQSKKYGCTYTRVGMSINTDGTIARREPQFLMTLPSKLRGQASQPHFEALTSIGIKINKEGISFCGSGKETLELVHAIIE